MSEHREAWKAFARAVEASGGPVFVPPDGAEWLPIDFSVGSKRASGSAARPNRWSSST